MNTIPQLIERVRVYEADHEPDGWPAIQMKEVTALADALEETRRERDDIAQDVISLMHLLADIREAAGDPECKLMQPELVEHIRKMRSALELVLKRGDLVKRSDQYMFEVLDAVRAALKATEYTQ